MGPFVIDTDTYYPSDWQRVNGDPHEQATEEEAPDPLGDETLSLIFQARVVYTWFIAGLTIQLVSFA